jgi:hypothetical protein
MNKQDVAVEVFAVKGAVELPPLPYPKIDSLPAFVYPGYTADQMREYGRQCAALYRCDAPAQPALYWKGQEITSQAILTSVITKEVSDAFDIGREGKTNTVHVANPLAVEPPDAEGDK